MQPAQNECILTLDKGADSLLELPRKSMDDKTVMNLFEKFTGCIKADSQVDCRREKCVYLDEKKYLQHI